MTVTRPASRKDTVIRLSAAQAGAVRRGSGMMRVRPSVGKACEAPRLKFAQFSACPDRILARNCLESCVPARAPPRPASPCSAQLVLIHQLARMAYRQGTYRQKLRPVFAFIRPPA